jgi:chromosome segregation ATPase
VVGGPKGVGKSAVFDAMTKVAEATACRDDLGTALETSRQRVEALRLEVGLQRQTASDHANDLRTATTERDRRTGLLTIVDELGTVRTQADAIPATLDDDLTAAVAAKATAAAAERAARDAEADFAGLLKEAKKQQKASADVRAGVTCSQCGQEVTAKHAEAERTRLAARVAELGVK